LFGDTLVHDEPLGSYLQPDEQPAYVLRNKKSGLQITGESAERSHEPDDSHQALALVTNVRLLVVLGQDSGDEQYSVRLETVVQTGVESEGFRTNVLTVETLDGTTWRFPCRGDPSAVAEHIDAVAQCWANAERLLDDAEAQIQQARERLAAREPADAMATVEDTPETIQTARTRARDVGTILVGQVDERANSLEPQVAAVHRTAHAQRGGQAHARAQDAWQAGDYERAAGAYDQALAAYETAYDEAGNTPADSVLVRRMRGAAGERELLRVGPRMDADTDRHRAAQIDHSQEAAQQWELAFQAYRDMLELAWGDGSSSFVADSDRIRQRAQTAADAAIEEFIEAGDQWLRAGDKLAVDGQRDQAEQGYEQAQSQFERANQLAREVRPDRVEAIEDRLNTVSDRLDGTVPDERPETDRTTVDATLAPDADPSEKATPSPAITTSSTAVGPEGRELTSRLDEPSQDQGESSEAGPQTEPREGTPTDGESSGSDSPEGGPTPGDRDDPPPEAAIRGDLAALTGDDLSALVADLWEAKGWSTTVFKTTGEAVYDVLAIQQDPEYRMLLWALDWSGRDPIGSTVVKRCATVRDSSNGADGATLVTNGSIDKGARERAEELDVAVLGREELAEKLLSEGFRDRVQTGVEQDRTR
jgi:tetratricopeptide (TPR) repeat protein